MYQVLTNNYYHQNVKSIKKVYIITYKLEGGYKVQHWINNAFRRTSLVGILKLPINVAKNNFGKSV